MENNSIVAVVHVSRDVGDLSTKILQDVGLAVQPFVSIGDFLDGRVRKDVGCVVVVLDLLTEANLEQLNLFCAAANSVPTIVITSPPETRICVRAVKMGIFDIVQKPIQAREYVNCVREGLNHNLKSVPAASSTYVSEVLEHLTPRQKQILALLVNGKSLKEIAADCKITIQTTWKHRQKIREKFGVANDVELIHLMVNRSIELRSALNRTAAS